MKILSAVLLVSFLSLSCNSTKESAKGNNDIDRTNLLLKWMSGTFDSGGQSEANDSYYDITLHMYPIWIERTDASWLYVEQSVTALPANPYRQRVYRVSRKDGQYLSQVYELPDPQKFVGKWRGGTEWDVLSPEDLIERSGCTVVLEFKDDTFKGSTKEDHCTSNLRGAIYATSEVVISADGIESWDKGFDEEGQQVWGATEGPYVFKRTQDIPD